MNKSRIALAVLAACSGATFLGREQTNDVSISYRMGGGIPGDINRTHPVSVLPRLQDATNPVKGYGFACLFDAANNTVRQVLAADQAGGATLTIAGILVRPYPAQQASGDMSAAFGAATPPVTGVTSVARQGFVIVKLPDFAAHAAIMGGAVYVRTVASTGNHVQGQFEAAADGVNNSLVLNARFASASDSAGIAEVEVWAG